MLLRDGLSNESDRVYRVSLCIIVNFVVGIRWKWRSTRMAMVGYLSGRKIIGRTRLFLSKGDELGLRRIFN